MPRGIPFASDAERLAARREYSRKWRERNRELHREMSRAWYHANRGRSRATSAAWVAANPEKVRASGRKCDAKPERKQPRGDPAARQRRWREKNRELDRQRRRAYEAKRRRDPVQRAFDAFSRRFRHVMAGTARSSIRALGYSVNDLRAHIASQFKPGMSWDNYGEWHIDHKRPVSSFDLPRQMLECWALSNLQPLWRSENCAKHAKWGGS